MKELSAEFKQARIKSGISQRRLAELAGVMQCTVSRFESGKQDVTLETAIRMAKSISNKDLLKTIEKSIKEQLKAN